MLLIMQSKIIKQSKPKVKTIKIYSIKFHVIKQSNKIWYCIKYFQQIHKIKYGGCRIVIPKSISFRGRRQCLLDKPLVNCEPNPRVIINNPPDPTRLHDLALFKPLQFLHFFTLPCAKNSDFSQLFQFNNHHIISVSVFGNWRIT